MYLARVIGTVVATTIVDGAEGVALRWVQPELADGGPSGGALVAFDGTRQAAEGDLVYLIDGREATIPLPNSFVPADATIVGIVDDVHLSTDRSATGGGDRQPARAGGRGADR